MNLIIDSRRPRPLPTNFRFYLKYVSILASQAGHLDSSPESLALITLYFLLYIDRSYIYKVRSKSITFRLKNRSLRNLSTGNMSKILNYKKKNVTVPQDCFLHANMETLVKCCITFHLGLHCSPKNQCMGIRYKKGFLHCWLLKVYRTMCLSEYLGYIWYFVCTTIPCLCIYKCTLKKQTNIMLSR